LKCYLQIENLLTFEPKAVSDKEQQIQNMINFAIAQGLPPEKAQKMLTIFREKAASPNEATIEIRRALKQNQPAGMLSSGHVAARQFAKILIAALAQVKEELKSQRKHAEARRE